MTNTTPEMASSSQRTPANSKKRPAPLTSNPGICRRISIPRSQPLQPREEDVQFGDADLQKHFKCVCSASAIDLLARGGRMPPTATQDTILSFLENGASPSYITQGTDFMHVLAKKVQCGDRSFVGKCLDCINANIGMGTDYDLKRYFVSHQDVLFKFLDVEAIFCDILAKVQIAFDHCPANEEELSIFEHAFVERKFKAADAILKKTTLLPPVKGKATWQEYLFEDEYVTCYDKVNLLASMWQKIPWETEGGQDAKRAQGNKIYKKFYKSLRSSRMRELCKGGVDLSMNGSVFLETFYVKIDKATMFLILESFCPDDLRNPEKYPGGFFHNLSTQYSQEDAIQIVQKIANRIQLDKGRYEIPLRAEKNDWRGSPFCNPPFHLRTHLTTALKENGKAKLAAALIIFLGFKASGAVMDDARVARWISHYGRLGFQHEQGGASRVECSVCYERMDDGTKVHLLSGCTHIFHKECIARFQTQVCPICRKAFVSQQNRTVKMA